MDTTAKVLVCIFGSIFIIKAVWLLYIGVFRRDLIPDDDDGPVSGWGTPNG